MCRPTFLSGEFWGLTIRTTEADMEILLTLLLLIAFGLAVFGLWCWAMDDRTVPNVATGLGHSGLGQSGKSTTASNGERADLGIDLAGAERTVLASFPGQRDSGWERLRLWIAQSGTDLDPALPVIASILLTVVPFAALQLVLPAWWLALPVFGLGLLPWFVIALARNQRCNRLREQLPDALDLMSRMLKAGQTIPQSLRGVADEFDAPIAEEFGYCYDQQNLGLSTDAAMQAMARRTGVLELKILVVAVTVHRHSGGNLSELLNNLAAVIRDRHRIQGQIRALTADGRMQAAILLALPLFLLVVLSLINRDYVNVLFQLPGLLAGMFLFEVIGAIWLHRIVSFDF